MSIRKINFFFLLTIVICSLNACVDSDPTLGVDFVPDDQLLRVDYHEFKVPVTTTTIDSMITSSTGVSVVGYMKNDPFGLFYAGTVFRILPATLDFTYPDGAVLDSAVLTIPVSTRMVTGAGDNTAQSLACYRVNKDLSSSAYYYNNSLKQSDYDEPAISEACSYSGADTISMRLTPAFAQALMSATAGEMSSDSLFLQTFRGIYLAADTSTAQTENGGRLTYFDYSSAYLAINYHKNGEDTARSYYYYIDSYSPNFNVFKHSSAHLANNADPSKIYMEGLAGVKPYIDANAIQSKIQDLANSLHVDISKIVVNKSEILLDVDPDYSGNTNMNTYPGMTTMAYKQDTVHTLVTDTYLSNFGGTLNRSLQQYAYNLTYYTQGLYTKHTSDNTEAARKLMIFPTVTVSSSYYSTVDLDRTYYSFGVLKGATATIKFTYTVLK